MEKKEFICKTFYDKTQDAFAGFIGREPMIAYGMPITLYTEHATKENIRDILVKVDKMFKAKEFDEHAKTWDMVTIKIQILDE